MAYAIDHYALRWRDAGHRVRYHVGPADIPDADVVIVSIDLSVVPQEYVDLINELPVGAVNGKILDISRRRFSQLMLSRTDDYTGPVIVKTNANCGGHPEWSSSGRGGSPPTPFLDDIEPPDMLRYSCLKSIIRRSPLLRMLNRMRKRKSVQGWDTTETLHPRRYPIIKSIKSVPDGVWENDNLVVERFIGNPEGGLFHAHFCAFFGDKEIAGRLGSPNPIVKFGNSVPYELTPVPDEVREWRKHLKIDYGRFDYLEDEGKYFLIDVNKTEGGGNTNYQYPTEMDFLASGLESYLRD